MRPDLTRTPAFFHKYIACVRQDNLSEAFATAANDFEKLVNDIPSSKHEYAYAPGKWTIKEVMQHLVDTERVFAYRALAFARKDPSDLPSFDENLYSQQSRAKDREWGDILEEFRVVRKSSELLFQSFNTMQLNADGMSSGNPNHVLAVGFILIGHVIHHDNIIRERYL